MVTVAESIDADALRIRHEFLSRPDLRASADSVALLLDISPRHAHLLLESLARDGFLHQEPNGEYVHVTARRAPMALAPTLP